MPKEQQQCTGCGNMMDYSLDSVWRPWVSVTTWSANEYYCTDRCWKAMMKAVEKIRKTQDNSAGRGDNDLSQHGQASLSKSE